MRLKRDLSPLQTEGYIWLTLSILPNLYPPKLKQTHKGQPMGRRRAIKANSTLCLVTLSWWLLLVAMAYFGPHCSSSPLSFDLHSERPLKITTYNLTAGYMAPFFEQHSIQAIDLKSGGSSKLLRISQVCVDGGKNGLVVPHVGHLATQLKDIRPGYQPGGQVPVAFRILTFEEAVGIFGADDDLWRFNQSRIKPKWVYGPTYFTNCWERPHDDTNPSHWLMKVNKFHEMAEAMMVFKASGQQPPLPRFSNLAFHQCPSYEAVVNGQMWQWGKFMFDVATQRWSETGLWHWPATNVVEIHLREEGWVCFEDLVLDLQYGSWSPGPRYRKAWTRALQVAALRVPTSARLALDSLAHRCGTKGLRIHIFQRTTGSTLRSFQNLEEVQTLLRRYTSAPVKMVTFDMGTPVEEQAREFQAFDILVTPHGSHLANIVFSRPETSSIVEVAPVVRDPCFRNNAVDANFSSYIISTGHRPVSIQGGADRRDYCLTKENLVAKHCKFQKGLWVCPAPWRSQLTSCDTFIDIDILKTDIEKTIAALCSPKAGENEQV